MKKRMLCCLLALVLAVGLLSACGSGKAAVYVQSVAALTGYGSLGGANASSGVVVAQKEIKVERDSSRKVKQLNVEVGQEVKSGEVLFTYDMEDMQLTIDKAKLEIEQMKNNVKDLTTQISQLEKEKKSAPTSEQLSYTVQIQALEADKKEAEYNITVKQKELDAMTSGSGTAKVTAPVDGKVQAINENGTDSSGNAAAYITLVQDGAYRVKGKINELNRSDIAVGVPVVIRSRVDDSVWSGTITEIDTENPSSGNAGVSYGYGYSNADDKECQRTGGKSPARCRKNRGAAGCRKKRSISDTRRSNCVFYLPLCTQTGTGRRLRCENCKRCYIVLRGSSISFRGTGGKFRRTACDSGVLPD